ncbi:hypothetical protein M0R45_009518 [Rubus argutus]|uniref:Vacuolar iron transporter n=1 Tax=Rubus argutus TaxID=59490 RepID=A0AAW1Y4N3_RUBAR
MAPNSQSSLNEGKHPIPAMTNLDLEQQPTLDLDSSKDNDDFDYSKRSQWLRAAVLGANDGLISTASLMMGVGAVKQDIKAMILTGFAGLVAGACSMAIGEFVSVYSQLGHRGGSNEERQQQQAKLPRWYTWAGDEEGDEKENLPNPLQAAAASALAFSVGAMVPLLAASFIREYRARLGAVAAAVTLALMGWLAMAITFGLTKLIGSSGL